MWHGAYLAWLEEARVEALAQVGLSYSSLTLTGVEMPVVAIQVNYFKALRHGEEVDLDSWVLPNKGVRWPWTTRFIKGGNELVAEASVDLVIVKSSLDSQKYQVIRRPPEYLDKAFQELQKGPE